MSTEAEGTTRYTYFPDGLVESVEYPSGAKDIYKHEDILAGQAAVRAVQADAAARLGVATIDSNSNDPAADGNRFLFTGYYFDTETNLYYANARYYDPTMGRFLTADSYLGEIDRPPSLHRYVYALNNPTRYVDPTGHQSIGAEHCRAYSCASDLRRQLDPLFAITDRIQSAEEHVRRQAGEVGMGISVAAANFLKGLNSPGHQTPEAQQRYYIKPETPTEKIAAEVADLAFAASPLLAKGPPRRTAPARPLANLEAKRPAIGETVPLDEALSSGEAFTVVEGRGASGTAAMVRRPPGLTREQISAHVEETLQSHLETVQALDPQAVVGFRGSLARGVKGPHKGNAPFDPTDFDVDAFIVSNEIAGRIPTGRTRFRAGGRVPAIREVQKAVDAQLRATPGMEGLRRDPFTFRVFTTEEMARLQRRGDAQKLVTGSNP